MAKIDKKGILHGKVSNIVYRGYWDMQIAQMKPSKVKQTTASKEASLEFGLAASTAACIRSVFGNVYKGNDGGMANRLTAITLKSIKTALHKGRGERDIHDGDAGMFSGFQFNSKSTLENCLHVKPEVIMSEGKLKVVMPAFSARELRGPAADYFVIRFLAVSFNFKTAIASYLSSQEIRIERGRGFEGGELELLEELPQGRMVLLGMFIHAYKEDHYDGFSTLNNKEWSPGGIIGGWHGPAQEEEAAEGNFIENERAVVGEVPKHVLPYAGPDIRKQFDELWSKHGKPIKEPSRSKTYILGPRNELPEGDFSMKK